MKMRNYVLSTAIGAAFALAGTAATAADDQKQGASTGQSASGGASQDKKQSKQSKQSSAASGATASPGAPVIVLVPVQVAARDTFGNGCWARLYDSTNFQGNQLSLVGPVDMPNMRTAFGTDWSGQFDSIAVGPKARLTVYDNENYRERAASFKPGQKVADLDEKMGFFEDISSVKVACAGASPTAQKDQGSSAASGASASGSSAASPDKSSQKAQ